MPTSPGPVLVIDGRQIDGHCNAVFLYSNDRALSGSAQDMSQGHGTQTGQRVTEHAAPEVSAKDSTKRVKFDPRV